MSGTRPAPCTGGHARAPRYHSTVRCAVSLIVAACPAAHADNVTVTVTLTPQGQQLAQGLGDSPDMLIHKVKTKVDDYYQVARVGQILRDFVDATSFVN